MSQTTYLILKILQHVFEFIVFVCSFKKNYYVCTPTNLFNETHKPSRRDNEIRGAILENIPNVQVHKTCMALITRKYTLN